MLLGESRDDCGANACVTSCSNGESCGRKGGRGLCLKCQLPARPFIQFHLLRWFPLATDYLKFSAYSLERGLLQAVLRCCLPYISLVVSDGRFGIGELCRSRCCGGGVTTCSCVCVAPAAVAAKLVVFPTPLSAIPLRRV